MQSNPHQPTLCRRAAKHSGANLGFVIAIPLQQHRSHGNRRAPVHSKSLQEINQLWLTIVHQAAHTTDRKPQEYLKGLGGARIEAHTSRSTLTKALCDLVVLAKCRQLHAELALRQRGERKLTCRAKRHPQGSVSAYAPTHRHFSDEVQSHRTMASFSVPPKARG